MSYRLHPTKNKKLPLDSPKKWYQFELYTGQKTSQGKLDRDTHVFFLTPGGAERMHLELQRQQGKQEPAQVSPTLKESLSYFLAWYKAEGAAEGTITDLCYALKHLLPHFGHLKFPAIPSAVQTYKEIRLATSYLPGKPQQRPEADTPQEKKKRKPVTRKTINRELSYLRSIVRWAEDDDRQYCEHGTVHRIGLYPKKKIHTPIPVTHSQEEIETILEEVGSTEHLKRYKEGHFHHIHAANRRGLSLLMYDSGLRKKEARLLEAERVDLPDEPYGDPPDYGCIITVRKGGKIQILPILTERLYLELKQRKKDRKTGPLYINPRTEKPYVDIREGLKAGAKRAGSEKRIYNHLLRHDFVSHLYEEDTDLKAIQELAGHSTLDTTSRIYTHVRTITLRKKAAEFTRKKNKG